MRFRYEGHHVGHSEPSTWYERYHVGRWHGEHDQRSVRNIPASFDPGFLTILSDTCSIFFFISKNRYYTQRNIAFGHQQLNDAIIKDGLWDPYNNFQYVLMYR